MTMCLRYAALSVLFAVAAMSATARAETVNCTAITTLPAVITQPGVYCLTGNLITAQTSGAAIDIQTNNVVLDLNGYRLAGLAAGPTTDAYGILAVGRRNITVRDGTIRGFHIGIGLVGTLSPAPQFGGGHLIEGVRLDLNTVFGISVNGDGSVIRNNQILNTGPHATEGSAAIGASGQGIRIINNDISRVTSPFAGFARGIFCNGRDVLIVNNRITAAQVGILFFGAATGKYRDNLTSDVVTPFTGGTDAGNNN